VLATKAELDAWVNALPLRLTFDLGQKLPDSSAAFETLRKTLAEHTQLRKELKGLREEVHKSLELLRRSIGFAQVDVQENAKQYSEGNLAPFSLEERNLN